MRLGCWVTEREGDEQLHCGLHHTPIKKDRAECTAQQAIDELHAVATNYEEKTGVVVNFAGRN